MIIELENGIGKKTSFIHIDLSNSDMWIDMPFLKSIFFCACLDGIEIRKAKCGEKGQYDRVLYPINWLINDWKGDKELIESLKNLKERMLKKIPELK